ncbi:hypothetical protein ANN_10775 [Periplaneta americana]|uniref:DUF4817 domain-containing protein n=1 Tax=Periplaneta americana TaxID=6978 RepID=A0ABQ8T4V1_PERAM|nr:hypothetical protein ANN_10775 [Periplaneta americana]
MEQWTVEHHLRNGDSVITTQRIFRRHINIGRNGTVPSSNTILRRINANRATGNFEKRKPQGPARAARTLKHRQSERGTHPEPKSIRTST